MKAIKNDEEVSNDILTQMLRNAVTIEPVNVEDLVDDFAIYFFAGQSLLFASESSGKFLWV